MSFWVLHYVNGHRYLGRFDHRWTLGDLAGAARFTTAGEASQGHQALLQEAADRLAKHKDHWPDQMWWDVYGGLVMVEEAEEVVRLVKRDANPEGSALAPVVREEESTS
jgi:hypothetical protein